MKLATFGILTGLFCAQLMLPGIAQADQDQYVVKQSTPSSGSNLRRPIILGGSIPLNKHYSELTQEQKNALNSIYEKMDAGDEPPFPANGLMPILRALGDAHEKMQYLYKGPITMWVQVDSQGNAGALYLVEAPDPQIGQTVANIMATQKFKPALCHGTPCSMKYVFHAELVGPDWQNNGTTATVYKIRDQ